MKSLKIILAILMCGIVVLSGSVYGYKEPKDPNDYANDNELTNITAGVDKIWGSVLVIVQIVSVACVVFAGLRYMYSTPDKKADIKRGLIYLVIGATFVFAASTVIRFIYNVGNDFIT